MSGHRRALPMDEGGARHFDPQLQSLPLVIQWDMATSMEQFVHRCGRAGRDAQGGKAYTLFTRNFAALVPDMVRFLEERGQAVKAELKSLMQQRLDGLAEDEADSSDDE